jgi:hypothetical protein
VDSAGYYYLVATKGTCSTYAGVNIKEYGVQDQRANIWHFGNHAGIDFNPAFDNPPTAPQPITGPLNTPEGCSTFSAIRQTGGLQHDETEIVRAAGKPHRP